MKQTKKLVQAARLLAIISLLLVSMLEIQAAHATNEIPITGIPVPGMESFDRIVADLMAKWQIPGGQVAVTRDGRLVFAHGYGQADVDLKQLVQPDSLFRIASISKPITAVAVLKLAEEGRLDLDAKAFRILDHLKPPAGASVDPRMWDITIRELLQHSGGWDRTKSFDPMFISTKAAQAVGVAPPASSETVIRYMLGQRLDFDPGTKYAYSNFGYCVLGRIIEKVTGQKYEDYVRANLLGPIGITDMRIGHTQLKDRAENEVHYYDYAGTQPVRSVFPDVQGLVPRPYGEFYLEAMDSHGGWIASAIDLVRFAVSIDGQRPPAFLKPETVRLMTSRPSPPLWVGESYWYGMGWLVRPVEGTAANWWHDGSLPGTRTIIVRTYHGLAWAAVFNTRPPIDSDADFFGELDDSLWKAANAVTAWPTNDLFATPGPTTTQTTQATTTRTIPATQTVATTTTTMLGTSTAARGGCLIATATYGSELSDEVQFLRNFRDSCILRTNTGSNFMTVFNAWYYSFSPGVAEFIREHTTLRTGMRLVLYPLIGVLRIGATTFFLFPTNLEAGAVVSGLLVSSVVGIVYFAAPLTAALTCSSRARRIAKQLQLPVVYVLFGALATVVIATVVGTPAILMMLATSAVVLTSLIASALYASRTILRLVKID